MPDIVHRLPLDQLALYCALLAVGATWLGIVFVKPFLRLLVGGEANVNESIGLATGMFSLFYGLLIGLLTVATYQNRERIEQAAYSEASSLGRLYSDMGSYPEPVRSEMRWLLRDYVLYTIHKDWPAHAEGRSLIGGAHRADTLRQRLAGFEPATLPQEIVHREVINGFQGFAQARQARLAGVITRIPDVLWYAVAVGAVVNIVLVVMLKIRPTPHLVLGGITSFFLGVMLFVVIALDDPLRGANAVTPRAFEALWDTRMAFDEPLA